MCKSVCIGTHTHYLTELSKRRINNATIVFFVQKVKFSVEKFNFHRKKVAEKCLNMVLYHCNICSSNVLENRLQKHHAKVHPNVNYDIYAQVPELPAVENVDTQTEASVDLTEWCLEAPKDGGMVHVTCTICGNKMPRCQLKGHMMRKHGDAGDQVDAIGVSADAMSLDVVENMFTAAKFSAFHKPTVSNNNTPKPPSNLSAEPAKIPVVFGKNPKSIAPKDDDEFYTVRISKRQMQLYLDQGRVYPKDGMFYIKDS